MSVDFIKKKQLLSLLMRQIIEHRFMNLFGATNAKWLIFVMEE